MKFLVNEILKFFVVKDVKVVYLNVMYKIDNMKDKDVMIFEDVVFL